MPGPVFAGPFHLQGEVASSEWSYTRYGNPGWARYESALGELEGGEVVVFASGMAAATALLLTSLEPGIRGRDGPRLLPGRAAVRRGSPRAARGGGAAGPAAGARERAAGRADALARVALEPEAGGLRPGRAGRGRARAAGAALRGGQHHRRAALPEGPGPGRGLRDDERHQASVRALGRDARVRGHARLRARPGAARLAHQGRARSRARSRSGSPTARWRRWRCAWSAGAPTRSRSPSC